MPKPGKMKNLAKPGGGNGLAAVDQVSRTSLNTPATLQTSMDANRLAAPRKPAGPSGTAKIETNAVLDGMPVFTEGTKVTQAARKRLLT